MAPSALHQHPQAVVFKVASPLDELHFPEETFRNSIVENETPHSDDEEKPFSEDEPYFLHFSRSLVSQQSHHFLEFLEVVSVLSDILSFKSQQIAKFFLK